MPRKKSEQEPTPETVTLSIEVTKALYAQILVTAEKCGYESVEEWLMDAISDKV